jgi:dihydrolipoamide dehydrogenase
MMNNNYDLIVLGSGPGGYVAAIRAAQLGQKVAIIERESLGGICLNWGCIPTKALLKSASVFDYLKHAADYGIEVGDAKIDFTKMIMRSRNVAEGMSKGIQFLMKKNKIEVLMGTGKLLKGKKVQVISGTATVEYTAQNILIATGARSRNLPNVLQDGKQIIGYREAMTLKTQPKSLVVMGSGAIGMEFAYFYHTLGTKVTVLEYLPNILPLEDTEVSAEMEKYFSKKGLSILTQATVEKVDKTSQGCTVYYSKHGKTETIEAELLLSAVGIEANIENIGLAEVGITLEKGRIKVDEHYQTNLPGYYAIGDVIGTAALAHVASAEGIHAVEFMLGKKPENIDYHNIPACIYTEPEVASVGLTERAAKEKGMDIKIGKFPFSASGKASAMGKKTGFVKLIFEAKTGEILGAHMVGSGVTEMIAEIVVLKKLEATAHEIITAVHPHPTLSEAVMEAAAAAYGEVIHL